MLVIGAKKASSSSSSVSREHRRRRRKKKASLVLGDDGRGPGEAKRRKDSMNSITTKQIGSRDTNWICIKQQRAFFGLKKRNYNNRRTHLPGDRVVEILRLPRKRTRDDRKSREYYYGASKHHRVFGHFSL